MCVCVGSMWWWRGWTLITSEVVVVGVCAGWLVVGLWSESESNRSFSAVFPLWASARWWLIMSDWLAPHPRCCCCRRPRDVMIDNNNDMILGQCCTKSMFIRGWVLCDARAQYKVIMNLNKILMHSLTFGFSLSRRTGISLSLLKERFLMQN